MNDTDTEQAKGAPRVMPEHIEALKKRVTYVTEQRPGGTTSTFVHAFLDGKFHLATGTSACVDPANFDADKGIKYATERVQAAVHNKLWQLEGYRLYCHLQHQRDTAEESCTEVQS